jgi:uncharacterized protein YcbX
MVYPVKGLRGVPVPAAETDGAGFLNDRRWMLAWAPASGPAEFRTQRNAPAMATLSAHVLTTPVLAAVRAWLSSATASGREGVGAGEVLEVAWGAASACGGGACVGGSVCPATAAAGAPAALLLAVDREFNGEGASVGSWAIVPLVRAQDTGAVLRDVRVWDSLVPESVDQGDAAAVFLTAVLPGVAAEAAAAAGGALPPGTPGLRLLYQDPAWERGARAIRSSWMPLPAFLNPVGGSLLLRRLLRAAWWAASGGGLSTATTFADGFPVLLATEESLAALNAAARERAGAPPLPMGRFRPNVVVSGGRAWEEDTWEEVRGARGGLRLLGVKRCSRCQVTTTDQLSGAREEGEAHRAEPLATLGALRASSRGALEGGVFFGMNMVVAGNWVGKAVEVGERLNLVRVATAPVGPL